VKDHVSSEQPQLNKSRRYILGAAPVAALALAACSSGEKPSSDGSTPSAPSTNETIPPAPAAATPDAAITVLKEGNARFAARQPEIRSIATIDRLWTEISSGQEPFAMVLGCADSRLAPELLFDQFVGDIFVVREAGNLAESPTNLGSLEFGHAVLKAKALVVLGHSGCGAVKAAFDKATPGGNIQAIVDAIAPGIVGATDADDAIERNVKSVIATVRSRSPLLKDAEQAGALKIAGAVYDIKTAKVRFL